MTAAGAAVEYPVIPPVPAGAERPFWSVMIPTYNRTRYLERTLLSVLAEDPGPERMQIEVVDNGSATDDAETLVRRVGGGRVAFHRQPRNLLLHENWNDCVTRARGRWVHLLHDDDAVLPGFYERYEALISRHPAATLVTAPSVHIDEADQRIGADAPLVRSDGPVEGFERMMATQNPIKTPSVVIARAAYEKAGGFSDRLSHTADWEMFFRAGTAGAALAAVEPSCLYRLHAGSDTSRVLMDGRNVREIVAAIDMCFARLPAALQRQLGPKRYEWVAGQAYHTSRTLAARRLWDGSLAQATWAVRLTPRSRFALGWLHSAAGAAFQRAGRAVRGRSGDD
jgi:GT2 family glycosyltransferase